MDFSCEKKRKFFAVGSGIGVRCGDAVLAVEYTMGAIIMRVGQGALEVVENRTKQV